MEKLVISAFYKFVRLNDHEDLRAPLLAFCRQQGLRGTILLAREGINGTVSGTRRAIDLLNARLRKDPRLADLETKEAFESKNSFNRMKVKLKQEIVTLKVPEADPTQAVGEYVKPTAWNALISDPDVTLIDTRNDFEVEIGSFKGAVNPKTESFSEFPSFVREHLDPRKNKKIAMFCTGGIRCEKATSYLLKEGFENVYHLQGGILKYLEQTPSEHSLWEGECFVFDERVSVNHQLKKGIYEMCRACGRPIAPEDRACKTYEEGVSCPACFGTSSEEKLNRVRARQAQVEWARKRNEEHIGEEAGEKMRSSK